MKRLFFVLFFLFFLQSDFLSSQIRPSKTIGFQNLNDTTRFNNSNVKVKLSGKTKYTDYKVISFRKDTTYIDTTLTIQKHYRSNFLRKDNFGLLAFHNIGQQFNHLSYRFDNLNTVPDIGFRAKQFFL